VGLQVVLDQAQLQELLALQVHQHLQVALVQVVNPQIVDRAVLQRLQVLRVQMVLLVTQDYPN
jgi:hypothetical protein